MANFSEIFAYLPLKTKIPDSGKSQGPQAVPPSSDDLKRKRIFKMI
jgi:hypothetical protein